LTTAMSCFFFAWRFPPLPSLVMLLKLPLLLTRGIFDFSCIFNFSWDLNALMLLVLLLRCTGTLGVTTRSELGLCMRVLPGLFRLSRPVLVTLLLLLLLLLMLAF
jgi:hypothetical protein